MLSLIIPVYRNESGMLALLAAVQQLHAGVTGGFEAIFVVDGSPDACYEILRRALPERPFAAKLVLLSRNFGSFAAIRAGLQHAEGDCFAMMAADLQEPPSLVLQMHQVLLAGQTDVVIATRQTRQDPLLSRASAGLFWWLYRRCVVPEMPPGGVDIFACNKVFRDHLLMMQESHSSLVAQLFWLGFRRTSVSYSRLAREHGVSAWTLRKKVRYFMDSVFAFTDLPIALLTYLGAITTAGSGCLALCVAVCRLLGLIVVPGYSALLLAIIFFGSLNVFGLGLVGSYAWRAFENTKARPLHVVLRAHTYLQEKQAVKRVRAGVAAQPEAP
jgi:glycosyltransferase involved in cell wall biosynthesis